MGLVEYSALDDMQKWICRSGYAELVEYSTSRRVFHKHIEYSTST
jgi:hypothetical protein